MKPRLNPRTAAPDAMRPMIALEAAISDCGLEYGLMSLVKMRASQINGCAYCLHMHSRHARTAGETEDRLYLLDAWRESPLYTDRERAALEWTEALTLIAETRAPDHAYDALSAHFTDEEKVRLTLLITTINAWNRISVGFRTVHPTASDDRAAE
jgi:AhpD family alkylhydroperoxidase